MLRTQAESGERRHESLEYVREWVLSVLVLVVTAAFFEGIFPEGSMSRYLKYIFSLILLAVILSPVTLLLP